MIADGMILSATFIGERYFGFTGGFSFVLLVLWSLLFQHSSPVPMCLFLSAFVIRSSIHNVISTVKLLRFQKLKFTRREGRPLLARLLPQWQPERVAWLEPPAVMVLGLLIVWLSKPLGTYLLLASLGLFGLMMMRLTHTANEMADISDAGHLQKAKAELFNKMQSQ